MLSGRTVGKRLVRGRGEGVHDRRAAGGQQVARSLDRDDRSAAPRVPHGRPGDGRASPSAALHGRHLTRLSLGPLAKPKRARCVATTAHVKRLPAAAGSTIASRAIRTFAIARSAGRSCMSRSRIPCGSPMWRPIVWVQALMDKTIAQKSELSADSAASANTDSTTSAVCPISASPSVGSTKNIKAVSPSACATGKRSDGAISVPSNAFSR